MSLLHVDSIILWSHRLEETVAFYRKIGLPVVTEQHGPDDDPNYALDFGDVHFGFIEATSEVGLKSGIGGAVQFGFAVQSVDETYRLALENGAKAVIPPQNMPFGRRAVVEDPDGRPIQFKQPR
jgi:lactoylglutathione lyase